MSLGVDFSRVNILVFKVETFVFYFTYVFFESEEVKFFLNRSFSVQFFLCSSLEVRSKSEGT